MASSTVKEILNSKRVYAIGDLHGCVDEPALLVEFLVKDEGLTVDDTVIFLGDYIDRGPASKDVVELMLQFKQAFPETHFLRGNHEDMMMDFLGYGGSLGQAFLYNGGLETIQSYGISVFSAPNEMVGALPPEHFKFFCELESILVLDNYICVHAGLNPLRDLHSQNDSDIFWIREEFIDNVHPFQKTIVFGHTPHREVLNQMPYKLGLDTGLVFGNKLTCMELNSGKTLQVERGSKEVKVSEISLAPVQNQRR